MAIVDHDSSELSKAICGRCIKSANSSLNCFAIEFLDGQGLLLEAVGDAGNPGLKVSVLPANQLPLLSEAVCRVDWTWIMNSSVQRLARKSQGLQLELNPAGMLTISVGVWQGSSFLTFTPYRPAR